MLDQLTSYLIEHKQFVFVNGSCLSVKIVKTGVPQESNLALYFFQYSLMTSLIILNKPQFCTWMIHA